MRGLIFEGISGSGKTLLLNGLRPILGTFHQGPLWIATEHLTERTLEPLSKATARTARTLANSHLSQLAQIHSWESQGPFSATTEPLFLLERFHLSLSVHIKGLTTRDFRHWEAKLEKFNSTLIWFRLAPKTILKRSVLDTLATRNRFWRKYVRTLGRTNQLVAGNFLKEQEQFSHLFEQSRLPKETVEIHPGHLEESLRLVRDILQRNA